MNKLFKNSFAGTQKVAVGMLCVMILAIGVAGCTLSGEVDSKDEETTGISIIGKWKLVQIEDLFVTNPPPRFFDYSQYNIVYEFKTNNILTVFGKIDNVDYRGLEIGNYFYQMNYNNDYSDPLYLPYPYMLMIDTISYTYHLASEKLEIIRNPYDDYLLSNLVKIK